MVQVSQRHTTDSRFYSIDRGKKGISYYPSVTTILGSVKVASFLDNWKMEQAEKLGVLGARIQLFLDAERGTRVHDAIEEYNKQHMAGKEEPIRWADFTDEEWQCFLRYHHWFHTRCPRVISAEHKIYSDTYGFAGTMDAVMEIEGKTYIVDFKTSKDIFDDYLLQVAAYKKAYEEMTETKLHGFLILALRVNTKVGWREEVVESVMPKKRNGESARTCDDYFEGFLRRKAVFDWERPDFKPAHVLLPDTISPFTPLPE